MTILTGDITGKKYNETIPSQLIRFALEALQWFEENDGYGIDMGEWMTDPTGDVCYACLGGAAYACKTGWLQHHELTKMEFALNAARNGHISAMFNYMKIDEGKGSRFTRLISSYRINPQRFKLDMNKLADDLEKANY